jgi:ferrous iron transport protein B
MEEHNKSHVLASKRLSEVATSGEGVIVKVLGHGAFRKRITEMGFVKGKKVKVIKNAPLQDPVEYEIMGYNVSLRRSEAKMIEVVSVDELHNGYQSAYEGTIDEDRLKTTAGEKGKVINIALVGNPNCGKTTLFNYASGAHERVGNYAGVTVDAKEAVFYQSGYTFQIADLPGTYSITEYSPEELYVRRYLAENTPDIVVNVVDASNLERNLYLTTQLIDMNIKVVIALNIYDELEKKGAKLDYEKLGKLLGIPIIPTVSSKGKGIPELFDRIVEVYEDRDPIVRHIHVNYGEIIEKEIRTIQSAIKKNSEITDVYSSRYLAIKLLEEDKSTFQILQNCHNFNEIQSVTQTSVNKLQKEYKEKSETVIADAKYGFIFGALGETFDPGIETRRRKTEAIDNLITHKVFGFPIFIFFMWVMFQTTFTVGSIPMDWIDGAVQWFADLLRSTMPEGAFKALIVDGIIGGVGGVIIFLPNILILFFFISLMEDTGYMARAAFIMDRLMHKMGLHGKSFIPLVMGFGCNVPAVMATRTLDNRSDRILTMLVIPFMSCSARLPVYVLLISAFFPKNQGLVLFSIYITGIILAIAVGLLFKKVFFAKKDVPFVMELPPYRVPTLRNTSIHMWHKGSQYLRKMGGVILIASILIWALGYYPRDVQYSKDYDGQISAIQKDTLLAEKQRTEQITLLEIDKASEHQESSYIGKMGHFIEPVIKPLGFDWKIGVSIITGLAAKEIVVSTMGVLYHADLAADENSGTLLQNLQNQTYKSGDKIGEKVYSPLVAYGLMIFVLIYFPCIAVIAAIKKEASLKWSVFTMVYTTAIAYVLALLVYQIGSLF